MPIGAYSTLQEFITEESAWLVRRQLPRTPLLYVHQNDCITVKGLWLEFGVFSGTTVNIIARFTRQTVYGFDSFIGLPENWQDGKEQGRYSCEGQLPAVSDNVELVPGSVIVFDELFNYPGYEQHEIKAFYEFISQNKIEWIGIQGPIELAPNDDTEKRLSGKYSGTGIVVCKAA